MNNSMKPNGFSLIEILIALVILSIAFLALAGLMVQTTRNNSFGGHMTEAATFAQDKLEQLRATSWIVITPGSDLINSNGVVKAWVPPISLTSNKDFARKWTVDSNGNVKTITVNINWNDKIHHSMRFFSVITQ